MVRSKVVEPGQRVDATILFADLVDSSVLSHVYPPYAYDRLVASFQENAASVVSEMCEQLCAVASRVEASVRGDELFLILGCAKSGMPEAEWQKRLQHCASLALQVAVRLKRRWLLEKHNRARINNGQLPLRIAIGLHAGPGRST